MTQINTRVTQQLDYRWRPIEQTRHADIPKDILPWLRTDQSITTKLRTAGDLIVELVSEYWGTPTPRERMRLGLKTREFARIRTVILKVDGTAVIYARSIIPARSLKGSWRYLPYLNNAPLGGYVYRSPNLVRSPIEITKLPAGILSNCSEPLWARRSIFQEYGPGILVNEVFYPSISELTNAAGRF